MLRKHINICFAENPNFPDSFWSHVKSKSEKLRVKSSKDASWGKLDTSEHSRSSGLQSGKSRRAAIKRFSTLLAFFVFSEVCVFIWHFPTDCVNTTQSKSTLPQTQRNTHHAILLDLKAILSLKQYPYLEAAAALFCCFELLTVMLLLRGRPYSGLTEFSLPSSAFNRCSTDQCEV